MKRLIVGLPLALLGGVALAQSPGLSDPTRPPASIAISPANGTVQDAGPVGLQTIIRRKGAKPVAVINGETVALGGKVGEQRVVKITETEVILDGPAGREVLTMTPGVEKKPVVVKKVSRPQSKGPVPAAKSKE
ncbi:MAG: MSHA biogenesis protein MshK [Rhodocyclaceae bacterium]|nr:MSHA biogenesis protein MshK [Rhodocyclaceae bacterium]